MKNESLKKEEFKTILGQEQVKKQLKSALLKERNIIIVGPPGIGKTIAGLQYLYEGYEKKQEAGMLIQIEEFDKTLGWYAEEFGWNLGGQQKKGKLAIFSLKPKNYEKFHPTKIEGEFLGKLKNIIQPMKIHRVVIDSITPLEVAIGDESKYRQSFYQTVEFLKKMGTTSIIISDDKNPVKDAYQQEEHICDGVIEMKHTKDKEQKKNIRVSKMTATNITIADYPFTIKKGQGIIVKPFL